jgi:cytochrome c biogenesis protein CcmG/thiol:disulfide interchange protein DsbE
MRRLLPILFLACSAVAQQVSLVNGVRALMAGHDFPAAERLVRSAQARSGPTPELAAAISWLARGALDAGRLDQAEALAQEASKMASRFLMGQKMDDDPWLPTAQGAAIEVHARVLASRGERPEAIEYLRGQLKQFRTTSIAERIGKNLNLLNMVGKPAPALEEKEWFGPKPPTLASLRGSPVLLFFWAHWCSDCKAEVAILAELRRTFAPQGLKVIGPTRLYGYVAGGEDAPVEKEKGYVEEVRQKNYVALADMPAPLSAANFITYGASTTPTLVLIDRAGVVRYYHPGAASEAELTEQIRGVLRR